MFPTSEGVSWGWSYGWGLALLPNLEQNDVQRVQFLTGLFGNSSSPSVYSLGNTTVAYMQLSVYICPSDGTRMRPQAPGPRHELHGKPGRTLCHLIVHRDRSFPGGLYSSPEIRESRTTVVDRIAPADIGSKGGAMREHGPDLD